MAGKRHNVGEFRTPDAKAQCERLLAEWLANGRRARVNPADISVTELVERFMFHALIHCGRADGSTLGKV